MSGRSSTSSPQQQQSRFSQLLHSTTSNRESSSTHQPSTTTTSTTTADRSSLQPRPASSTSPSLSSSHPNRLSTLSLSSSFPIPTGSTSASVNGGAGGGEARRTSVIYERSVASTRGKEVSLGAWAFLFAEIVQYTQKRVSGIGEFEKRLNLLGYRTGHRLLELLPLRDSLHPLSSLRSPPPPSRTLRLLPLLSYIHSPLYKFLFGRAADSLEQSTEHPDEYMVGDDDMLVTRSVVVPADMAELSCGAVVAGIVEGVMDGAGFPARVTAHSVPTEAHPRRTVILIKLDPEVMAREAALNGK